MPEMSVVRFNESDVIVASSIIVSNAEDHTQNLTITRNNVRILYNKVGSPDYDASLVEDGYGENPQFVYDPEFSYFYSLSSLIEADNGGNPMENVNGEYIWSGGRFVKKQ